MRRNYNILLLVLVLAFGSCSFTTKVDDNPDKDKLLIQIITLALDQLHFEPKTVDDAFSKEIFEDYLEQVDPLKRYFLKSDIDDFKKYETEIDDQLKAYDISFFNAVHERLIKRQEEAKAYYKEILEKPFDFSKDEEYNADYENLEYSKNKKQLKERWRQQLKFNTLSNYETLIEQQENDEAKEDNTEAPKSLTELEEEARNETLKALDNYFTDYIEDMERKDWFAMYVNTIVEEYDPHTSYMAPVDKDRFDQQMSGKLEGIGARLQKKMDYIKIVELISGGPAWRDGLIEVGDVILKVRQGDEKEAVSIVGMRIDDAIKLIKGPKGTDVVLTMKKVDGTIEDIKVTRDLVELEETYAKSSIVKKDDRIYGVINLPKFYVDFNDYKERNAASDIKLEIERLKEQGIEGLVLDLRNNGGGSLKTVVDMAGLFIEDGPIVQVRETGSQKEVLKDTDRSITWDGPLVIMVNELSASASEILAAAMQDYKRAIIIGSKQTYGKGTVQNVLDLNRMVRNSSHGDLGALKLTRQKFYRINGGSTQLEGVKSDIAVPDRYSFIDIGERDQENPLPWDKITPVDYDVWDSYFDYDATISKSKQRMANNEQLKLIEQSAIWAKKQMDDNTYSLNYKKYKEELKLNEEQAKQFDAISDYKTNLTFNSLPYEQKMFEQDTVLKQKRERWHENLSKDVYVEEALNVLDDLNSTYRINKVATIKD
ncbi:carboxyl-terminal processing protease [Mesoflavibacter sabulilitoris]|uniref:Tail-specific protease n=1 Tax=Mesoflavibacter zeaxanthinifaciens subsp. sabulilitoris TaxID=1520893 RepID=A0A2T1N7K6_9FLAO|nr:carboxy terminal-processing peptidase [Mesoflavibacter zeaxanthinifaciens]MBB3123976.1 carboxyl-terminal processing protease [Mesoflavibacter zeaxanthinifaciens subsp. sabulilitoris]PSG87847.1 tail-specific protease [Mesoflavibacter zeaxanthinifaciens subsp. sabulilitoris]